MVYEPGTVDQFAFRVSTTNAANQTTREQARANGRGKAFRCFFSPRVERAEDVDGSALAPTAAILVSRFGDHGLHTGRWPVVGVVPNWDRMRWSLPQFVRAHDRSTSVYLVEYDDNLEVPSETIVTRRICERKNLPYDSQSGSAVVEARLSRLLNENAREKEPNDVAVDTCGPSAAAAAGDGSATRWVEHYIYLPTAEIAATVADKLVVRGFSTQTSLGADGTSWLVLAGHRIVPTESALESIRRSLDALVGQMRGEYDGWEISVHEQH